jgi:hypothetical protein
MQWDLDALKILAKNSMVPGVALQDAIKEIEKLQKTIEDQKKTLKALRIAGDNLVDMLETEGFDADNSEIITAWHRAQGV